MAVIAKRYQQQHFELVIGDDLVVTVTVQDEAGAVVDITGATINYTLNTPTPVTLVGAITDAVNGVFTLTFADTDTAGIAAATYDHQCQMTDGPGLKSTIFEGKVRLKADLIT